jgi:multicomponent Na+:H+ antiporter subunit D
LIQENLPVLLVVTLLFTAYLLPIFTKRRPRIIELLVVTVECLILGGTLYLAGLIARQGRAPIIYPAGGWPAPWGIELSVGSLSILFLLMIAGVGLPVAIFATDGITWQLRSRQRVAWFFTLYLLLAAALAGLAVTNDLFNVYVFVEVATISCCALVAAKDDPLAIKAAFRYLLLATVGSGFIFAGIGLIYLLTGNLNMTFAFAELSQRAYTYPHVVRLAISFFVIGFGTKAALFPLHLWLPDAHSAALTPASAILSGLAVKGYIIALAKILYIIVGPALLQALSIDRILLLMGMVAIVAGSLLALAQDELKRRLAYSTVAQVGYIFLGLGLMNTTGLAGALFYAASHAIIKACLFLAAGAIISRTGKERVSQMAGVGREMPITMGIFTICSFALMGLPLLSGFIGKWNLLRGSIQAGSFLASLVIILGSLLCAGYLLPVIRTAYFVPAGTTTTKETSFLQISSMLILTVFVIVLGIAPGPLWNLAWQAARDLLGG